MPEGKPSAAKKPAAKKPAPKPSAAAGGKAKAAPPPEKTKDQKKKEGFKQKLLKSFSAFHGFWTPILSLFVILSIAFFFSGIEDKDTISYSLLIFKCAYLPSAYFNCIFTQFKSPLTHTYA